MADSRRELRLVVVGNAKGGVDALLHLSTAAEQTGGRMKRVSEGFREVGSRLVGIGTEMTKKVTLPIAAAGAFLVKSSMDVQKGLHEVVTLFGETGSAAEATFGQFQKQVSGLSKEVGVAQTTITGGLYQAISAGVPKENAFEFLRVASKAAIAGVTDTKTAIDGITTIINAFGLKTSDAQRVADSMFTTVRGGKTTFAELSTALFNVAPAAAASGVKMEEVNAALATMTSAGVPTAVATTQLRAALVGLQRPSKDLDGIFAKLGFKSAQVAIEQKGMGFALEAVSRAAGGNNGKLQTLLGSVEAVAATQVLAGTGSEKFRAELDAQAKSAGATGKAFEEMDKGRNMERLKVSLQNLAITVGNALLPVVKDIADAVTPWLQKFGELSPTTQKIIIAAAGLLAVVGPLVTVIGALATVVGLLLSPVGLVVLAFAGLVAAFVYAYTKSETFRDIVNGAFETVSGAASAMKDLVYGAIRFMVDQWLAAAEWIVKAGAAMLGWVPGIGPKLKQAAKEIEEFRDDVNRALGGIKDKTVVVRLKGSGSREENPNFMGPLPSFVGPRPPGRASGGDVGAGRVYRVGEQGEEWFVPGEDGAIIPNRVVRSARSAAGVGAAGGVTVDFHPTFTTHVSVPAGADQAAAARAFAETIRRDTAGTITTALRDTLARWSTRGIGGLDAFRPSAL